MTPLFKKLNFKTQKEVLIINAPAAFQPEIIPMKGETTFFTDIIKVGNIDFVMVFVTQLQEIEQAIQALHPKLKGDAVLWFCYPKGTSKKYKCEFNRDNGFAVLGNFGLEPVRMVAIDADWSALRFRKVKYIKVLNRNSSFAISLEGKERAKSRADNS